MTNTEVTQGILLELQEMQATVDSIVRRMKDLDWGGIELKLPAVMDWRKNLPDCPFEVRIMEKECKENDDEKVSMFFPVTIGEDGKYEVKAEDLMNAAIEMFDNNLRVKWDGLLPKGWHSVDDANVTG